MPENKIPYIYLYQIDCDTPGHHFVGYSKYLDVRLQEHRDGCYGWTKTHGVKKFTVLNRFTSVKDAKKARLARIQSLRKQGLAVNSPNPIVTVTKLPPVSKPERSFTVEYLRALL